MQKPIVITSFCSLRPDRVMLNDHSETIPENYLTFADRIKTHFKKEQIVYPKFYKMDNLSKLGFLCGELVLREGRIAGRYREEDVAVILSNASASLDTDLSYQATIRDRDNYFPSPSVFVYTLANIVIGELCIRHKLKGENAFLVCEAFDAKRLLAQVEEVLDHQRAEACLCGWVEILQERYEAVMFLVEKRNSLPDGMEVMADFSVEELNKLYHKS